MKCCTKMPCPLPHNHYCCSLPSPVCLPHLLICYVHVSSLHPYCLPTIICVISYVDLFFFVFFLIFVICYIFLWLFICFVVCIFFFELMSNLIFGLFFEFTCLFFLLVAILNSTNLVTLLFHVIVLVVYAGFICCGY